MSLWRQICFSQPDWRTPSIIELWLSASDRITQSGMQLGDGRNAGLVRDIARGEDERGFLAVQIGKLALQLDQRMVGPGDIAGTASAQRRCDVAVSTIAPDRPSGAAPCRDNRSSTRSRPRAGRPGMPGSRVGNGPAMRSRSAKTSIALFFSQAAQGRGEERIVIHAMVLSLLLHSSADSSSPVSR